MKSLEDNLHLNGSFHHPPRPYTFLYPLPTFFSPQLKKKMLSNNKRFTLSAHPIPPTHMISNFNSSPYYQCAMTKNHCNSLML